MNSIDVSRNPPSAIDPVKVEEFAGKVFSDTVGLMTTAMSSIGDRLGLFKDLAARGPATSQELAERARINERYAREWLGAMASAGYLTYDAATTRFALPPEHAPVLAQEAGPAFFGGVQEELVALVGQADQILGAFRDGGGIPYKDFPASMYEGIERFTAGWFENLLIPVWIPAIPGLEEKLQRGIRVADIGCGRGRALIKLAGAFPESRFVGYDLYGPNVDAATATARAAGVAQRVTFRQADVSHGLPESYDLITTFDVVHDAADPLGLLRAIRQGLRRDGTYLCLEINCADSIEKNLHPLGALFYGCSVLLCTTVSLADGGAGLGTLGLPEAKLRELAEQTGFRHVRRVPLESPFNTLYELQP